MTSKQIDNEIIYYFENGWKLKDIAIKLDLTPVAVKSRLQRIRRKREIKRWWEE